MTEKSPLSSPPSDIGKEEASNVEEFRAREQEHRAHKKVKKQEKKERQENKREERAGKVHERFQKEVPEGELAPPSQTVAPPSVKKEFHQQWEIEALEGALGDLEKEKMEREEETARLVKEAEERDRKEREEWPSNVARALDKAHDQFEASKHDKNPLSRLRDLQMSVGRMVETYQRATQHGWLPLPHEESRLLQLKRDIENQLEFMAEKTPTPPPSGEEKEPQIPLEAEPQKGQTREEKIAAFRARREELAKQETGKSPYEISQELADFNTAEHYHFNAKEIDKAINEAKQMQTRGERGYQNKVKTIEMLERVKALIEEPYEIESRKDSEPLAGKREEDIEDMKSPEGASAPLAPEPMSQKSKEKQYTEKDSVEGWKHYIAKEEERMQKEKPLTPKGEAPPENIAREVEMPPEKDRDALKKKLFPEQFRKPDKKGEQTPQGAPAEQAAQEAQPVQPLASEGATQESPEMKRAIDDLLGEELGRDAQMRAAAAAVVGARRAMREALTTRKEERLYAEAGAGFIAPERLQEATQLENAYENALVGLSARLRESAKDDEAFLVPYLNIQNAEAMRIAQMREATLTPERRNIAVRLYQRLNNPFNRDVPPRWARYVRVGLTAAVLGGGAAAFGGLGAAGIAAYAGWRASKSLTFAAANGIARSGIDMALTRHADAMMGKERGKQKTAMQEALKNKERIEALRESLRTSIRGFQNEAAAQLENRKFYGRAATFGLTGLSGLISYELARPSAVAADEGAFGAHVATNEDVLRKHFYEAWDRVEEGASATKQHIEDMAGNITARARELYNSGLSYGESFTKSAEEAVAKAETYVFGGKPSAEVIEDVIGKSEAGGVAGAAEKAAEEAGETAPLPEVERPSRIAEILTDEQREEALKQYYGLVESAEKDRVAYLEKSLRYAPSDEWREEALKRYYGLVEAAEADRPPSLMTPEQAEQLRELQEKGVLTDDQIETLKRNWEGRPPLLDAEEIEKLQALREKGVLTNEQIDHMRRAWEGKLEALGKESIATVGKGGSIWEASRSLIGEGEGKISKEQWLEAWEKSDLANKGFVKPGATVRFDAAEGLLKVSEAKDNEFLYQALQKEGKPIPGWLEDWRDVKDGRPSAAEVTNNIAERIPARPAASPEESLRTPVAGAKGGTFEQLLQNEEAQKYYVDSFGRHSFDQQEALLAEFKNAAERLEENVKGDVHSSVRAAYEQEVAQTKSFINNLENNAGYQGNLRAWEALEKEWGRKVGVSEAQFEELSNEWTVELFLDTAKKIENHDFVPSDSLSKVLEARRLGTLEMAEKISSKLPDKSALKTPLGRFLKNTL